MSIEALNYANTLKIGNTTRKYILTRLADRADERYSCYPAIALLAAEAEISERQVQKHLAALREVGIVSDKERNRADGSQTTSRYFLHGPWDDYGGTGVPFETIVTPRQARQALWEEPPREGEFRPGTVAARASTVNSDVSAGQEGVSSSSPPGVSSSSPGGVSSSSPPGASSSSPLESPSSTPTTEPSFETGAAPSARSAADAGGSTSGSRGSRGSGSAAKRGAKAPKKSPVTGKRMSREQAAKVKAVEACWPAELAALLPNYRPPVVRDAILEALDSRTPEQLARRISYRWLAYGYANDVLSVEGRGLDSPVGVAVALVSQRCADPMCEDGTILDTGNACRVCEQRAAERAPSLPKQGGKTQPAVWECEVPLCRKPGFSDPPEDGLCDDCRRELELATARLQALDA
ncbi:helix-turn-helix domain-containing protein [Streptomyces cellulosae]|uniref:Helix-turn-helix domain-containing protein n=1 Tax=Streptomyces cellulosae TaxID=1968 RepID=A0ABW6JDL1_STRCE